MSSLEERIDRLENFIINQEIFEENQNLKEELEKTKKEIDTLKSKLSLATDFFEDYTDDSKFDEQGYIGKYCDEADNILAKLKK